MTPGEMNPAEAEVEQYVERCWQNGNSIGETRVQLARAGHQIGFEEVRRRFVSLSWRYA